MYCSPTNDHWVGALRRVNSTALRNSNPSLKQIRKAASCSDNCTNALSLNGLQGFLSLATFLGFFLQSLKLEEERMNERKITRKPHSAGSQGKVIDIAVGERTGAMN